ncbi:unnamed protein product [Bursaphelenchus xylophilus]|uniref:(pine wood nematode) hypothetical protein n=1 Tax=Bursaphelenchus xylophilus TaxID=6326 RepID=A0A7I8WLF9_BURXY|nr:unnamed protein product [Bursaphelenchus xylophilus]CAG9105674.1 unnamed protein product [Bursaphelenchus xylophilus]
MVNGHIFFLNLFIRLLQVLILNAAVASPAERLSKDSYNATFAVNHLAHFYLTLLLKDKFTVTPPSRVVVLSSELHRQARIDPKLSVDKKLELLIPSSDTTETALTLYSRSKLCNVLFALKLHRELSKIGVNVNAVHPGFIETALVRSVRASVSPLKAVTLCRFAKTIQQGAATTVYAGFHPDLDKVSGHYFEDCWDDRSKLSHLANDEKLQDALWNKSIDMINEASLKF